MAKGGLFSTYPATRRLTRNAGFATVVFRGRQKLFISGEKFPRAGISVLLFPGGCAVMNHRDGRKARHVLPMASLVAGVLYASCYGGTRAGPVPEGPCAQVNRVLFALPTGAFPAAGRGTPVIRWDTGADRPADRLRSVEFASRGPMSRSDVFAFVAGKKGSWLYSHAITDRFPFGVNADGARCAQENFSGKVALAANASKPPGQPAPQPVNTAHAAGAGHLTGHPPRVVRIHTLLGLFLLLGLFVVVEYTQAHARAGRRQQK